MGFWDRIGIGALGVGEVVVKAIDDAGSVLFDESKKAIADCKKDSSAGNVAANVAKVTAITALSGVCSIIGEGYKVGTRCYKEIKEDYQQEQAELQRAKEKEEEERRIREEEEQEKLKREREERRERLKRIPVTSKYPDKGYTFSRRCYYCHREFYIHKEHFIRAFGIYYPCPYCGHTHPGGG